MSAAGDREGQVVALLQVEGAEFLLPAPPVVEHQGRSLHRPFQKTQPTALTRRIPTLKIYRFCHGKLLFSSRHPP